MIHGISQANILSATSTVYTVSGELPSNDILLTILAALHASAVKNRRERMMKQDESEKTQTT